MRPWAAPGYTGRHRRGLRGMVAGQGRGELGGAGKTVGRKLVQGLGDGLIHLRRHARPLLMERSRRFLGVPGDHRLRRGPGERRLARQHLVEHAAEAVDVGPGVDVALRRLACSGLMYGGVPTARPAAGQPVARAAARAPGQCRSPPPGVALGSRMFSGLMSRWTMPCAVGVAERVGDLAGDLHRIAHRELAFAVQPLGERLALDIRHDVVEEPAGLAGVVHRQDVRVVELGGDLDLAQEAVGPRAWRRARGGAPSARPAVVLEVLGQKDRGHAAAAELALDRVTGEQCGRQPRKEIHGTCPETGDNAPRSYYTGWAASCNLPA